MAKRGFRFYLKKAESAFLAQDYRSSLFYYSIAAQMRPKSGEVIIGVSLASMAEERPQEAHALFEFFTIARTIDLRSAELITQRLIDSIENHQAQESPAALAKRLYERVEAENGISYKDFKRLVDKSDDFRSTFESVIYSTRVIISDKKDFFDFVEDLIDNGYTEMALAYIESANIFFPSDEKIRELLNKISKRESLEIPSKK